MNNRRLSLGLLFSLTSALLAAACGGEAPPAETPPTPSATAPEPVAPPASAAASAEAAAPAATTAASTEPKKEEAPPAPKPAKEKIVGRWVFDFSGDVKTKAEEAAHKTAGKADKDGKKFEALMKTAEEKATKKQVEATADGFWIEYDGDKQVMKVKFEVSKDDGNSITLKLGKDEVSKKDLKTEVTINFKDDTTIAAPDLKDAKKAVVSFKKK